MDKGINLKYLYVDTVGDPDRYRQKLEGLFPSLVITVEKKADSKFPVVSAASICAKVCRTRHVEERSHTLRTVLRHAPVRRQPPTHRTPPPSSMLPRCRATPSSAAGASRTVRWATTTTGAAATRRTRTRSAG
eukprot:2077484-Prymnesium_polylepis.1